MSQLCPFLKLAFLYFQQLRFWLSPCNKEGTVSALYGGFDLYADETKASC